MTTKATIYHNPRCSKSRQTLAILEELTSDISVIKYLETPPSAQEIETLLKLLGIEAHQLLRTKEQAYQANNLSPQSTESHIIEAMTNNPILIERPIVATANKAVIGRPPENVKELF